MTEHPLVKINVDPPEKIAKLYGIGSKTAFRIVEHRRVIGAFHGPDDLAEVKGISADLAITLALSIDWELPKNQDALKERDWFWSILFSVAIVAIVRNILLEALPNVSEIIKSQYGWLSLWINISILISYFCAILFLVGMVLYNLVRDKIKASKLLRFAWTIGFIGVLSTLSVGFGNATYYQFFAPNKWFDLVSNQRALIALAGLSGMSLILISIPLTIWFPRLRYSSILARSFDIGTMIVGPLGAIAVWGFRTSFPLWVLILLGFAGCLYIFAGFNMIRWRNSFFESLAAVFDLPQEKETNLSAWQSWINARLPDPEQQQALKEALDKTYPPSKFKTFVGLVIISSGGWLTLTALGAVIQWLIEKGLNQLWP